MCPEKKRYVIDKINQFLLLHTINPLCDFFEIYNKLYVVNNIFIGAFYGSNSSMAQVTCYGAAVTQKMHKVLKTKKAIIEVELLRSQLLRKYNVKEGALLQAKRETSAMKEVHSTSLAEQLRWHAIPKDSILLVLSLELGKAFNVPMLKLLSNSNVYFVPIISNLHLKNNDFVKKFKIITNNSK